MPNPTDIKKLFATFQAKYNHKWVSAYDTPETLTIGLEVWHRGLEHFPDDWITRGLANWIGSWPPSLPEFQAACLPDPAAMGINMEQEAINRVAGDSYNFKRMSADRARPAYTRALAEIQAEYLRAMINNPQAETVQLEQLP